MSNQSPPKLQWCSARVQYAYIHSGQTLTEVNRPTCLPLVGKFATCIMVKQPHHKLMADTRVPQEKKNSDSPCQRIHGYRAILTKSSTLG
ncbi:hypothetical protein AVEN_173282-1 [Araneus ventricosus]|uniref:Uncharacterized protein n=1 Tax=Araneus ventricosus TaxID=182803 RepID=A0A4Y2KJV7_ARAVE|nr:hypothetical protein AVEN_173282-1 [Araneus ventricosus]